MDGQIIRVLIYEGNEKFIENCLKHNSVPLQGLRGTCDGSIKSVIVKAEDITCQYCKQCRTSNVDLVCESCRKKAEKWIESL
jgi:hypothetical protein